MPGGEGAEVPELPRVRASSRRAASCTGCTWPGRRSRRRDRAIVVEGYTDVIALHAAGFENAVAAMGTSLTEEQLRELRRLCRRASCSPSTPTPPGQEAALRGMGLAERSGLRVRIVALPAGRGPGRLLARRAGGVRGRAGAAPAGAGVPHRPRARARERRRGPRRRLPRAARSSPTPRPGPSATSRCAAWRARCGSTSGLRGGARARPPRQAAAGRRSGRCRSWTRRPAPGARATRRLLAACAGGAAEARAAESERDAARDLGPGPRRGHGTTRGSDAASEG